MKIRIAESIKQPVLNSIFISKFNDDTFEILKDSKPFATYHKKLQEYEVTHEVFAKLDEPVESKEDQTKTYPMFERKNKEPFGYQQDAVDFARKSKNVLINFPQGMGKSLATMMILNDQKAERALIICGQANLQEEWIKDATKHDYRDKLKMNIVGGDSNASSAKRIKWLQEASLENGTDVVNIEALRNEKIVRALNARNYGYIAVDEIQSAKGWKAIQTQGLHNLKRHPGQMRIALSGTPVLNDPLEFFSLLKYFGQLGTTARTTFNKHYGIWSFDFWGHYICKGYRNMPDLIELVKPIICYANKDELDLPPKTRQLIKVGWEDKEEFAHLAKVYKMSDVRLKKAGYKTKPQVRALMQYLSSTCPEKVEFVAESALTDKLLVFSQYTTVLDHYREKLVAKGLEVLYYHGKLGMKQRLEVLKEWATGYYDVLLLSIMTARYGLNLTEATETIFVDIPTSLAVLEQAEDRSHRIGQTKPVKSYLLCCSPLDEKALKSIEAKQVALDKVAEAVRTSEFVHNSNETKNGG